LRGACAIRKEKERSESSTSGCQFEELTPALVGLGGGCLFSLTNHFLAISTHK